MLTAALAVLCALLTLVLLVQRPAIWPVLVVLVVAWGICMAAFRYQLRAAGWPAGSAATASKNQNKIQSGAALTADGSAVGRNRALVQ